MITQYIMISFISILLVGCMQTIDEIKHIGQTPPLSRIDPPVMWAQNHQIKFIRKANSLWQTSNRAFFKDSRARNIGDILKVKIDISDNAKLDNKTESDRTSDFDMGFKSLFGFSNKIAKALKVSNTQSLLDANTKNNQTKGNGKIDRKETIKVVIAAMVKQILPNGNLVIRGTQEVRVNYEVREVYIEGIVRSEDISAENTVDASQIAEARISYGGRGRISRMQKPRYGTEFFDIIMPW